MSTRVLIILICLAASSLACLKEEPILPQDALYVESIIEEFSVFDPCDTVQGPAYQLSRRLEAETTIRRLFYLQEPNRALVLLGRAAGNTAFEENTELYFHGLSVLEENEDDPTYILSEDEVNIDLFAASNLYLIGKASAFDQHYLFLTSSDGLAASTFGEGDVFKVQLYEVEETSGMFSVRNKMELNAKSSGGASVRFEYASLPLPNAEETAVIQQAITDIKAGNYAFDPANQVKKFDSQLSLYQRDFRFAAGLVADTELLSLLSEENQRAVRVLERMVEQRSVTAFFCLSEQQIWSVSNNLAPQISTPLD